MLPYRFRRTLSLAGLGAVALGATVLFLPAGNSASLTVGATRIAEPERKSPSYIVDVPRPTTAELTPAPTMPDATPGIADDTPSLTVLDVAGTTPETTLPAVAPVQVAAVDSAAITPPAAEQAPVADGKVAVASAVNVRAGPSTGNRQLYVLQPGARVTAVERSGNWVRVVNAAGESGWVFGKYLDGLGPLPEAAAAATPPVRTPDVKAAEAKPGVKQPEVRQTAAVEEREVEPRREASQTRQVVATPGGDPIRLRGSVTMRDRPSRTGKRIFVLEAGEQIRFAEVQSGWARVVLPNGVSGWIPVR